MNNVCSENVTGCCFAHIQVWQTPESDQLFHRRQRQPDSSHQADGHLPQAAAEVHQDLTLYPEIVALQKFSFFHLLAHFP